MPRESQASLAPNCPICGKPAAPDHKPFCSTRCADVDLQRWLTGRYAIPVVEDPDGPDDEADVIREP
jgi:endogenous inhibitor of DNA gyrase (YacG/DUF329 family)